MFVVYSWLFPFSPIIFFYGASQNTIIISDGILWKPSASGYPCFFNEIRNNKSFTLLYADFRVKRNCRLKCSRYTAIYCTGMPVSLGILFNSFLTFPIIYPLIGAVVVNCLFPFIFGGFGYQITKELIGLGIPKYLGIWVSPMFSFPPFE